MKKIYLTIGCLTLMQTSAYSLLFSNDLKDSGATIVAAETVDRTFNKEIISIDVPALYQPTESSFDRNVFWSKGNEIVHCQMKNGRKTFEAGYTGVTLNSTGCVVTPK